MPQFFSLFPFFFFFRRNFDGRILRQYSIFQKKSIIVKLIPVVARASLLGANLSRATPNLAHAYLSVSSDIGLLKDRIIPCYTPDQYTHTLYLPNATRLKSQHAFEIAHVTWSAFPTQSRGI